MPRFRNKALGDRASAVAASGRNRLLGRARRVWRGPVSRPGADYRVIPADTKPDEVLISHISVNFDRTGFQEDWNVVFPLDRLRELADKGAMGSVAQIHYSFMGATDPVQMEPHARELAGRLKQDAVDAVILPPV